MASGIGELLLIGGAIWLASKFTKRNGGDPPAFKHPLPIGAHVSLSGNDTGTITDRRWNSVAPGWWMYEIRYDESNFVFWVHERDVLQYA
jgi:hypothetical protein